MNALDAQLRRATHSQQIARTHRIQMQARATQDLPVARGVMIPGLGDLGVKLVPPKPRAVPRARSQSLALPIDHRLSTPATTRVAPAPGKFVPGMGDLGAWGGNGFWRGQYPQRAERRELRRDYRQAVRGLRQDFKAKRLALSDLAGSFVPGMGDEDDFMPGMGELGAEAAAKAHRKPHIVSARKPRIMGAPAPGRAPIAYGAFVPGMGEEDEGECAAVGYLTASELADDEIPGNTTNPGAEAAAAASGAMKTMVVVAGVAFLGGALLKMLR